MTIETVRLQIPFESLVDAISSLGLEEKRRLWQLLDEEITQAEEDLLEEDPTIQAETGLTQLSQAIATRQAIRGCRKALQVKVVRDSRRSNTLCGSKPSAHC
ncbi:MAG TPA: hypothetical protein V6D30_22090, partial [Leptolyngbyaceae cyanobacterium]